MIKVPETRARVNVGIHTPEAIEYWIQNLWADVICCLNIVRRVK